MFTFAQLSYRGSLGVPVLTAFGGTLLSFAFACGGEVSSARTSEVARTVTSASSLASSSPSADPTSSPPKGSSSPLGSGPPGPLDSNAPSCVAKGSALDPRTLKGYVMSRQASRGSGPKAEAEVASVDVAPATNDLVTWKIQFRDAAKKPYDVTVLAPPALPCPLVVGQRVRTQIVQTGGGPNTRYDVVIHHVDGTLLLAVNQAPSDWKALRGALAGVRPGSDYDERSYGARIEHGADHVDVPSGKWARLESGACSYYVWGSGAERTLHPGKPPMPDYVGQWLDFAIVRAR